MIMGAIRENPATPEKWGDKYGRKITMVLYCSCKEDKLSVYVSEKLIRMGFHKVYVLQGGWNEWLKAGYPIEIK
jgi:3-mercaptopyruvate sulfurtransferase SseA